MNLKAPSTWPTQPRAFHVMVKPRGSICNLDCQYCFYLKKEKLYPQAGFRMSADLLETYIRQYIASQAVPQSAPHTAPHTAPQPAPEVTFAWQGGEPTLMGLDFFRQAVELQAKYRRPGMTIHNAL